ncbi:hypothetical protein [Crenobacter intestini]|uniref:Uncharacterized protein n=1 Tax=Crenobacter intestini TaxID=2563443 RepID=A0A4T0UP53_9NEIS|nr:hypothetical protein [Crenobacter intestini]TIC80311.1 hypothetical protein E5K04_12460 [Crenobacter intestini]
MTDWHQVDMAGDVGTQLQIPRSKNRIRAVSQAVHQFFGAHGRDALFSYKNKDDSSFGLDDYFYFHRPEMISIRCRRKHEILSMPYIFSDVNLSAKNSYKLFVADFYSESAIRILDQVLESGPVRGLEQKLVFEHVRPCKSILEELRVRIDVADEDSLNDFFEERLLVAILTKEENELVNKTRVDGKSIMSHMPDNGGIFARYVAANVENDAGIQLYMPNEAHRSKLIASQFPLL